MRSSNRDTRQHGDWKGAEDRSQGQGRTTLIGDHCHRLTGEEMAVTWTTKGLGQRDHGVVPYRWPEWGILFWREEPDDQPWHQHEDGCRAMHAREGTDVLPFATNLTWPPPWRGSSTTWTGLGAFFDIIHQDPVLSQVKLVAEPWELGSGGYQVGNFPHLWAEWNGLYRDTVRRFWKGDSSQVGGLAYRLTGSSDLYAHTGRRPYASINFVTAHDGFTLHDLVSYNDKHNEANGEDNRDGHNDNLSWNGGVEGPTADPAILTLRERQKRHFLATLVLSQGMPMLLAGDEIGRTQQGNNNAYCQDNELSWVDWQLDPPLQELLDFVRCCIQLCQQQPTLHRRHFFQGRAIRGSAVKDLTWFRPDGKEMTEEDWSNPDTRCFGLRLAGDAIEEVDERGRRITGDTLLILLNAYWESLAFILPAHRPKLRWQVLLDTRDTVRRQQSRLVRGGRPYELMARSLALFRLHAPNG